MSKKDNEEITIFDVIIFSVEIGLLIGIIIVLLRVLPALAHS